MPQGAMAAGLQRSTCWTYTDGQLQLIPDDGLIVVGAGTRWEWVEIPEAAIVRACWEIVKLGNRQNSNF